MIFRKWKSLKKQKQRKEAEKEAAARIVEERLSEIREHYTVHMIEIDRICPPEQGRSPQKNFFHGSCSRKKILFGRT